ncbi:MAG: ribonuclease H-like domain-containing protein [Chitinophagaceae bacterium]|nr:ribonuclease H-like domain-containing protein [Chitinophagaceae bacterium]
MLGQINLTNLLVIDIETVPGAPDFQRLSEPWQELWQDKISKIMPENTTPTEYYLQKAGILAEFGRIVCISTGFFYNDLNNNLCFKLKSFSGENEVELLQSFSQLLDTFRSKRGNFYIAGHNVKEFDIPYICRRMIIQNLPLPESLQLSGKKPWETNLVDTMELWKFGDYKNYVSLKLLAGVLGIDTPKDDIDGSMVRAVYYEEKNLPRIVIYCQKDVITVANILLRFRQLPYLKKENIIITD